MVLGRIQMLLNCDRECRAGWAVAASPRRRRRPPPGPPSYLTPTRRTNLIQFLYKTWIFCQKSGAVDLHLTTTCRLSTLRLGRGRGGRPLALAEAAAAEAIAARVARAGRPAAAVRAARLLRLVRDRGCAPLTAALGARLDTPRAAAAQRAAVHLGGGGKGRGGGGCLKAS